MAENIQGINIGDYAAKREKGIIEPVKVLDDYVLSVKRFSQETGEEVKPRQVVPVSIAQLEELKTKIQEEAAKKASDIDAIIADLKSLDAA